MIYTTWLGRLQTWINRFFKMEQMDGDAACPVYLRRWTLWRLWGWAMYVHHFLGDDWSRDLHDHPRRFISIGLWGGYWEDTDHGSQLYKAPWVRSFPAEHKHRLRMIEGRDCWTLVLVLKNTRPWGFWHGGRWISWKRYVNSPEARGRLSCKD